MGSSYVGVIKGRGVIVPVALDEIAEHRQSRLANLGLVLGRGDGDEGQGVVRVRGLYQFEVAFRLEALLLVAQLGVSQDGHKGLRQGHGRHCVLFGF